MTSVVLSSLPSNEYYELGASFIIGKVNVIYKRGAYIINKLVSSDQGRRQGGSADGFYGMFIQAWNAIMNARASTMLKTTLKTA